MKLFFFHTNFYKSKYKIVFITFFVFFLGINHTFSQIINNDKFPNDKKVFDNSLELISENDFAKFSKAMHDLERLEIKYKELNDRPSLAIYYLNLATIFYSSSDASNSLKYIDESFKYVDNDQFYIIGKLYELKAVSYSLKDDIDKFENYSYISKKYLEKSKVKKDLADTYFNLITIQSKKKNWNRLIALVKTNDSLFNNKRSIKIDLMLSEAYIVKGQYNTARALIKKAESTIEFKEKHVRVMALYHDKLSLINVVDKDYKSALENAKLSKFYSDLIYKDKLKNSANIRIYQSNNLQTKYELNQVKNDNNLQQQIVKNQKLWLFFSVILIVLLLILFLVQYKSSKLKTSLNNELNRKNFELRKAIQIKNKLLDSISHELRTPLNAIKSVLYLFKNDEKEKNQNNIELIDNATNQLINLVSNVIDYNVIDNTIVVNNEVVDLKELIGQIVEHYTKIRQNENKVNVYIDQNVSNFIVVDKARLNQILSCLIDNAFKFTSKGYVNINVSSESKEEHNQVLKFKINDTGIGISKENLLHIFDLFNQGSNEVYLKYGGSGLGLALVQKNVELLKGNISITSEENVGTTAEFTVEVAVKNQNVFDEDVSIVGTMNSCKTDKILVVEDNKINQLLIQKILLSKGYKADLAENGQIAVDIAKDNEYCLILMDIMMPVMDGFEASKQIKKLKPHIPIIALTAISEELNKNRFLEAEIEKILNKPIKVEQLDSVLNLYCA